ASLGAGFVPLFAVKGETGDRFQPFYTNPQIRRFGDCRDWFFEKRFGMFVHWGLYAIPGWHEQHQWRGRIERNEYVRLAQKWNPVRFDPEQWLDLLEETGMKYICITTKHHDGFCLWDTRYTSFNTMNTPYGKDIIGMLSEACHKRGIPLCLYYSIADWNHPNYPNQGRAHELDPQPQDQPNWYRYLEFLKGQVRELCSNYGVIHGFWWDINRPAYEDPSINKMIREMQPCAIINNRGFDEGDFGTPERDYQADDSLAFKRPTEACQSVGIESWGYRSDEDFYTDRHLMRSIDRYLVRDANYLLNIGPKPDGSLPDESVDIFRRIGRWYSSVRESFEGVEPAGNLTTNRNVILTSRDRVLYVHINRDIPGNVVRLTPINVDPVRATLLNDGSKIDFTVRFSPSDHRSQKAFLNLVNLPVNHMCNTVPVIKLEFDRPLDELAQPVSKKDGDSGWGKVGL
ncbi:MAG: alpha-L-fucosidase, partial [Bacteroidales bacterium]